MSVPQTINQNMYMSPKMYVLKRGSKSFGMTHLNRQYVIGFKTPMVARKVHYNLRPDADESLRIERSQAIDVTQEVKEGLKDISNITYRGDNVTIDTQATLFIPKIMQGSVLDPMNDGGYHLNTIDTTDFIMYPFEKRVGIIMPYALLEERPHEYVFWSQVIEPADDPKSFAYALDNIYKL